MINNMFLCRNKSGMSLIEVSIALLIVGISVPILINLQTKLSRTSFEAFNSIENIILMKNLYAKVALEKLFKEDKDFQQNVGNTQKTLKYIKKSYPDYNNLLLEKVSIENTDSSLVNFRFYPELSLGKKE